MIQTFTVTQITFFAFHGISLDNFKNTLSLFDKPLSILTFSFVFVQSCLTLCNPMNFSTWSFLSFLPYLPEFAQSHVQSRWHHPTSSSSVNRFSSCPQSFPASWTFSMSWLFASRGQSIGASISASILPMNIQHWFPLGLTDLVSLLFSFWSTISYINSLRH